MEIRDNGEEFVSFMQVQELNSVIRLKPSAFPDEPFRLPSGQALSRGAEELGGCQACED